jgi:hypothetical protein
MVTMDSEQPGNDPADEPDQDAEPTLNAPAAGRPDGVEDEEASPTSSGDPDAGGMARRPPADS